MASISLLETFRVLSSFSPARTDLRGAPWEDYVDWSVSQGLAPLAAYNLEYRLSGAGAPEWARDQLLSIYQGSVNDNVMKLVNFKRAVDELEGRKLLLLGGATFAEALYPHVGFRPVLELQILLPSADVQGFAGFMGQHHFKPEKDSMGSGATQVLSDGRTPILLFSQILGPQREAELEGVFARAKSLRMYGPSFFRPDLEDAVLLLCLEHAREGYTVPLVSFMDLRELVTGATSMGSVYSRPLDTEALRARAKAWGVERPLFASLSIVEQLFPETRDFAQPALPSLRAATQQLLQRLIVRPVSELGKMRRIRGGTRLRRWLTGQ